MTREELLALPLDVSDFAGWDIGGPHFKDVHHYLSQDGSNPEAPWRGYGWPLGSECWYFYAEGHGRRVYATGLTAASALDRLVVLLHAKAVQEKER